MYFEIAEAKLADLEARLSTLENLTCPQQSVIDDLTARLAALEASGGVAVPKPVPTPEPVPEPTPAEVNSSVTHPAGTYGPLTLTGTARLIGAGIGKTIIRADSLDSILTVQNCGSLEIAHLTIQGNYTRQNQRGLHFKGRCPNVHVHDVEIRDVGFSGIINDIGAEVSGKFERLAVSHCGDFGVQFRRGAHDLSILDGVWRDFASRQYPGHAIYLDDVDGALVARHTISGLPQGSGDEISGVKVTRESDTPNKGIVVQDVTVTDAIAAVSLPYAINTTVKRVTGTGLIKRGVYLLAGGENLVIEDCQMSGAAVGYLINPAYGIPSGVSVRRCSALGCKRAYDWGGVAVTEEGNAW